MVQALKGWGHPDAPPPTVSDSWGGIDGVMIEVYSVVPEYQGLGRLSAPSTPSWADSTWRAHLTLRLFNGRLARKTLGFSISIAMYRASTVWEDAIYNLVRPPKTLRDEDFDDPNRRWKPRTSREAFPVSDIL